MCGFAGFIDFQDYQQPQQYRKYLSQMGQQLFHRGPDEEQVANSPTLWLVYRRLSIIDVSEGMQPIWNENQTMFVVVNGEIYNHRQLRSHLRENHQFRTQSDAEIILHLYEEQGPKALESLNGMFAIVLWDKQRQQLFLARDRLGVKPLYYTQVGSQIIFGSTLASLIVHPNTPCIPQFQDLTNLSPTTSYVKGLNRLAGGHYLLFDATTKIVIPQCYWNLADYLVTEPVRDPRTPRDYVQEFRLPSKTHSTEPTIYARMKQKIVQRIFPEFQQKYLDNSQECLLTPENAIEWFKQLSRSYNGVFAFEKLLNGMVSVIFNHLCYQRNSTVSVDYLYKDTVGKWKS